MPASFDLHGGLIDITFIWPDIPSAMAQEIIFGCALYRWRNGEGPTIIVDDEVVQKPWANLTNQEKLNMAYRAAQKLIIAEAKTALVTTDVDIARDAATDYADDNYKLPE